MKQKIEDLINNTRELGINMNASKASIADRVERLLYRNRFLDGLHPVSSIQSTSLEHTEVYHP